MTDSLKIVFISSFEVPVAELRFGLVGCDSLAVILLICSGINIQTSLMKILV